MACSACTPGGVHTCSTSTVPLASRASSESNVAGPPQRSANARASAGSRSTTATSSASGVAASAAAWAFAIAPVPMIAARSGVRAQAWVSFEGVGRVAAQSAAHAERVGGGRRGDARASARPGSRPASRASRRSPVVARDGEGTGLPPRAPLGRAWRDERHGALVEPGEPRGIDRAVGVEQREEALHREVAAGEGGGEPFGVGSLGAGQRRGRPVAVGVGEHVVGEGHHGVARLGQPGVLHDDAHLEVAAVVHDAVDHPGLEPHERAGLERMLREARRRRRSAAVRGPTTTR